MSLLNNLFDILRGWPREGAIDETFPVHITGGTYDALTPGMVVVYDPSTGTVEAATTPDLTGADAIPTWVVIETNQDFSGTFLQKVVCIRANAVFRLDPSNITTGSYTRGALLSFSSGIWTVAATKNQVIGEVLEDNRTVDGTLKVYYSGGMTKKF